MATLYQDLVTAGLVVEGRYSDLHTPYNSITKQMVKEHNLSPDIYRCNKDGTYWYDIRFAYDPYWVK